MAEAQRPVSYHLNMFEYFAHFALQNPNERHLIEFACDSLDFLQLDEAKNFGQLT